MNEQTQPGNSSDSGFHSALTSNSYHFLNLCSKNWVTSHYLDWHARLMTLSSLLIWLLKHWCHWFTVQKGTVTSAVDFCFHDETDSSVISIMSPLLRWESGVMLTSSRPMFLPQGWAGFLDAISSSLTHGSSDNTVLRQQGSTRLLLRPFSFQKPSLLRR